MNPKSHTSVLQNSTPSNVLFPPSATTIYHQNILLLTKEVKAMIYEDWFSYDKDLKKYVLFDGKYIIHEEGYVTSHARRNPVQLVGKVVPHGYRVLLLHDKDKKRHYVFEHRLIAMAYVPNPLGLDEVNHKDGNKLNNCAENLEWCTCRENQIHCRDNLNPRYSKINIDRARELRELSSKGYTTKELCEMFDLKSTEVRYIITNKRWCE